MPAVLDVLVGARKGELELHPVGPVCSAPGSCSGRREAGGIRRVFGLEREADIQQTSRQMTV